VKLWSFGGHVDGLLAVLGYLLPPGGAHDARQKVVRQVLEDLKAVAVDYLGGMVVGPPTAIEASVLEFLNSRAVLDWAQHTDASRR
jgi:hypothetical protein